MYCFHKIISPLPLLARHACGRTSAINHSSFCNSLRYKRETMTGSDTVTYTHYT